MFLPTMCQHVALVMLVVMAAAATPEAPAAPLAPYPRTSGTAVNDNEVSCPSLRGQGCAVCIAHKDGRAGRWYGSPCVHTSVPEGGGKSKSDCMPASWWEAAKHPGAACVGNATGCAKTCGPTPPAQCTVFANTDFSGHEFSGQDANTAAECCSICGRTPGCGYYTFTPPVRCSLKTSKAGVRASPNSTSGCRLKNCSAVPLPPAPGPAPPQVCTTGTVCGAKFSVNGKGCCPYENAVCCSNDMTCCPAGSTCKVVGWQSTCVGAPGALSVGQPVCKTGAPLPLSKTLPNVLVIGDSVSIGYTPKIAARMADIALVQHSPWDLRDGGAEETAYVRYGIQSFSACYSLSFRVFTCFPLPVCLLFSSLSARSARPPLTRTVPP